MSAVTYILAVYIKDILEFFVRLATYLLYFLRSVVATYPRYFLRSRVSIKPTYPTHSTNKKWPKKYFGKEFTDMSGIDPIEDTSSTQNQSSRNELKSIEEGTANGITVETFSINE